MIDRNSDLSISAQAKLLGISRGSVYYLPLGVSQAELALMRQIDEMHLEHPFMGARQLVRQLRRLGLEVGRLHVRTLMNLSTTFVDDGVSGKTPTVYGGAKISTAQGKSGGASILLNGSTDYLKYPTNADFDFGTGDFTIDVHWRAASTLVDSAIVTYNNSAVSVGADVAFGLAHYGAQGAPLTGKVRGYIYSGATQYSVDSLSALNANQWYYIRFSRESGVLKLYLDGVLQGSTSASVTVNSPTSSVLAVGKYADSAPRYANGYIDELHISKGTGTAHAITAVYAGDANNTTSSSGTLNQVVNRMGSATALGSSPSPSEAGGSVTFTATVTGSTPTGTVTFKEGATTLGTGTIASGVATYATSALVAGVHSVTASYGGNTNNASSNSTVLNHTVNPASSSTALVATPNPAAFAAAVTFTATVTGITPTGTVTFKDGATALGIGTLSSGVASFATSVLSTGTHSITAVYSGNANNATSTSSAVAQVINAAASGGTMIWQYGYDAMGRPTTTVDPNGLTTTTYYDSLGRPIQSQQPPNVGTSSPTITQVTYNLADGITAVIDPRVLSTTYAPNGVGDVKSQVSPDSGTSSFTHDAKGNVLTSTDARGKVTTRTYDALERITAITYPTGTATALEYDGGASPTPATKGELTKMTDESGVVTYGYDSLGRMTTKTVVTNGKTFVTTTTWGNSASAMDKVTAITYPSGSRVNYSYDAQGYLSAITVNPVNTNGVGVNTGSTLGLLSAITYNADNNLKGWTWSDTSTQAYSYNAYGILSGYNLGFTTGTGAAAGAARTITRDAAGRITGYTHTNSGASVPSLNQSFTYDNLNRLLSANLSGSTTQYTFDATGNRKTKVVGATTYTNTISSTSNRVTQTQDVGGTFSITYDSAGNITGDGTNTFTYSDRGRMATATNAGGTVTYKYNALNQRVSKTGPGALVPSAAAYYVYDEIGQLLGEYDANGYPVYETIYLGTLPVGAMKRTGTPAGNNLAVTRFNIHADHLGAPRIITRPSDKAIVWRWDTAESYGGSAPNENPNALGAFSYNQRFPGQVFDAETGLFQNWNREYDSRQGRYRQSDPIGLAGGINTYSYANASPVMFTDPRGLFVPALVPLITWGVPIAAGALWASTNPGAREASSRTWDSILTWIKPPENAYNPEGSKALGRPTEADGFKPPKGGDNWVPNPNPRQGGSSWGWQDAKGDVWCPTGPVGPGSRAHGGPHWDVQTPGGGYSNERPKR